MAVGSVIFWNDIRTCTLNINILAHLTLLAVGQSVWHSSGFPPLCNEPVCWNLGRDMKNSMNLAVNPCEDFYEFVCGNWINVLPGFTNTYTYSYDQMRRAQELANYRLKDIMETWTFQEINSVRKAKEWYFMCTDDATLSQKGIDPIEKILQNVGGWPTILPHWDHRDWQDINNYYTTLSGGESPFYKIKAKPDLNYDPENIILELSPPKFLTPAKVLLDPITNERQFNAYEGFFRTIVDTFMQSSNVYIDREVITRDLVEMLVLEMFLAKTAKHDKPVDSTPSIRLTISELQYRYNERNGNNPKSQINWLDVLQKAVGIVGVEINESEEVEVIDIDYFDKLPIVLYFTNERAIVNHVHWQFVSNWIRYTTPILREAFKNFTNDMGSYTNNLPRWQECIEMNPYNRAIIYEYINVYVPDATQSTFERLLNNIKFAMDQQISNANWMDEQSKNATRSKLMSVSAILGAPTMYRNRTEVDRFYEDLLIEPGEFFENIKKQKNATFARTLIKNVDDHLEDKLWNDMFAANAYHLPDQNKIYFYSAMLMEPMFVLGSSSILELYNSGGIGSIIGHEVGHGFDDNVRKYHERSHTIPLWTEATNKQFAKIRSCFIKQFSSYDIPGIKNETTGQPFKEDGEKTFNENLVDAIGLQAAFAAFEAESKNLQFEKLPYMEQFDNNQLFFISGASVSKFLVKITLLITLKELYAVVIAEIQEFFS
ncbi:endothelin-converting enzyme 1 [Orussus abietinus]|uniref:endothelin-converting enzyme 1 n=1 Tax=Orussus abietinus TaxID=222816 RepID=UPI000C715BE7|nr:endothelin-converting enzyme 1 [Orussus abietinus]